MSGDPASGRVNETTSINEVYEVNGKKAKTSRVEGSGTES